MALDSGGGISPCNAAARIRVLARNHQDNGELRARMVGRWGHARLLPHAELVNGGIRLVSPKEEEGRRLRDMIFEGRFREARW